MRTIELGVTITNAAVDEKTITIFCAPVTRDPRCPDCGRGGRYRDTISRPLTDLPVAGYPLVLQVAVPRYRCTTPACGRAMVNRDLGKLAALRSSTTRRCARYMLRRLMIDRTTVSAIAAELGVSWHTVSAIAMRATADLIAAAGSDRLTGVRVIGVDEHRWAPRRVGPAGFVTLIIDLTPTHDQTGPVRLLDLVEGRSATALASWLAAAPASFAQGVKVIAMDGFAGYKTAATEASAYRRWCTSVVVGEGAVVRVSTVTWTRVMMVLAVVAVVTAAVVAVVRVVLNRDGGSAPAVAPLETSEPVPATSPAVPTAAVAPPPPGFPDLDGFTDVSQDHDVTRYYPLATFRSPTGLQCAMWSSRGDTAASCFGAIPGLDHPANQVYAGDYKASFDQNKPPDTDKLNGKPLASGEKVILGAGGNLMGGDQITCGVQDLTVACMVIREFRQNHGDDTAQRHGFVLSPQTSWTF